MEYITELDWTTDFKVYTEFFKEWANEQPSWHDHMTDVGSWVIVRPNVLEGLEHFRQLNVLFKEQGFMIHDAVFRSLVPKRFIAIHTDSVMTKRGVNELLTLSLNIPLENQQSATTRWYDFSNSDTFKHQETREGVKTPDSIFAKLLEQRLVGQALACSTFSFRMNKPVMINTGLPHNVDTRLANSPRSILSVHLRDLETGEVLGWEERHRVLNITF